MKRLIGLLLLIPILDILLLFVFAHFVGWVGTMLLVVLTALLGMLLVRAEGRNTLRRINQKVATGSVPSAELLDGALLIAAGAFFLTPGLVTDLTGVLLALPPTRYPIRKLVHRFVVTPYLDGKTDGFVTGKVYTSGFPGSKDGSTIDLGEDDYTVEGDRESN